MSLWYTAQPDASDAVFDSPSGREIAVPVRQHGNRYVALLDEAREAGYYTARVSVQAPGMPIAVNVDKRESDVKCLSDAALGDVVQGTGMFVVSAGSGLLDAIDQARTGRSFWRLFMVAALLMLFLESLLADRMRRTASPVKRGSAAIGRSGAHGGERDA